ncbi:MAG: hypothetical protein NTW30_04840 [Candidatus Aenigmarchaeota archaeon]|nr:hypothetical protein [Candidatus Aenigmarchaeota archaeon]
MANDLTATCTFKYNVVGDLKIITVITPSAATSDYIDLHIDDASSKITKIFTVHIQEDDGTNDVRYATWSQTTGVITFGTLTTGIHHITIVGY